MVKLSAGFAYKVHDARKGERAILEALPRWEPGSPPIRLVVPSSSLRLHWIRLLTKEFGAVLGLEVVTHSQLVRSVILVLQVHHFGLILIKKLLLYY